MDQHLTRRQLAERWSRSTGWLANMACHGTGPKFLKIGARVLYRLADIEEYEASSLVATVDAA